MTDYYVSDPPLEDPPLRRSREQYDAERFVQDLDAAIAHVRDKVLQRRTAVPANPHLQEGLPREEALARVCDALVLRQEAGAAHQRYLDTVLRNAREMLISKNKQYGDSALNPVRVFSQAPLKEQLLVRLDDKVSRLVRGEAAGEDVAGDTLGYLLLVEIAEARERASAHPERFQATGEWTKPKLAPTLAEVEQAIQEGKFRLTSDTAGSRAIFEIPGRLPFGIFCVGGGGTKSDAAQLLRAAREEMAPK